MSEEQVPATDQAETLTHHLTELRKRVMNSLYFIVVAAIVCYTYSEYIFKFIRKPIAPYLPQGGFVFLNPVDKFTSYIHVSLISGLIISCPFWMYQVWQFVAPGLYAKEKKYGLAFIIAGSGLFLTGVAFVYFLVFPVAFEFLLQFGGTEDKPMITIGEYLSFFMTTMLIFGIMFEMPLVLTLLGIAGVIDKAFLAEKRRYAIVALSVISALVTPPDVLSMLMLLIPMMFLYEVSIIIVGMFEQKRQAEVQAP